MKIIRDDLTDPQVLALLEEHFSGMLENSPKDQCHFLDIEGLKSDGVTFWSIWDGDRLAGIGAVQELDDRHGEIKSMRVSEEYLGRGAGRKMLDHIIAETKDRGYSRLSLETGSGEAFAPAISLYKSAGFDICEPFGDYKATQFNQYMSLELHTCPS
ncbi:GNAT family N-acetyltransferase [Sphingorhabdus sp. Alg239-R122]|uniref:GNAT family N-acetyltransferase n=1 Tax=Sphingorhabdus sp. Alg239-R122 TaxID=2305989 RepID=UPI0013DA5101|nr:GNAT family N-acetyltransferase [Sphingorhabdus sp. Alg239-R122]